ncbi:phosphatidylinositol 4,5-bisphosphate 3-kinase catalytic subunit delta isoform-like [Crassostrea virginica]
MDFLLRIDGKCIRMNPYSCIATGREEGMIEIVTNTMTISKIQLWYNHGDFVEESLYEWLKFHNPNEESLSQTVEELIFFLCRVCSGYVLFGYRRTRL